MLSKNNFKERLRKMEDRQDRFSIRKFSIGAVSVLIGSFIFGVQSTQVAHADTLAEKDSTVVSTKDSSKVIVTLLIRLQIITYNLLIRQSILIQPNWSIKLQPVNLNQLALIQSQLLSKPLQT